MREVHKRERWLRLVGPLVAEREGPQRRITDKPLGLLVERLPERQKEVVVLRVFHDLSVAETSAVLEIPEGTVKSNFFKAMENLRSRIGASQTCQDGDKNDLKTMSSDLET
jgi:DNA-directed RNA polymerase specialized sigma24 family protein